MVAVTLDRIDRNGVVSESTSGRKIVPEPAAETDTDPNTPCRVRVRWMGDRSVRVSLDVGTCSDRWRGFGDVSDDRTGSVGGNDRIRSASPRRSFEVSQYTYWVVKPLQRVRDSAEDVTAPRTGSESGSASVTSPTSRSTPTNCRPCSILAPPNTIVTGSQCTPARTPVLRHTVCCQSVPVQPRPVLRLHRYIGTADRISISIGSIVTIDITSRETTVDRGYIPLTVVA
ncbi:hypothetical protein BDK88_0472 [Natrinema hispanicum]|uniref:Uncharacterized protein n=1 Tax=Natrinema hispanicum TaxID=392421 RepID=A0A482YI56_9EURY|nr:hypothetical protein BDK88_0472 [Natrinema hispanicum]